MALKDVLKKGSGAPAPADLIIGGIGVDTANKRLYFKADDGTVVPHDKNTPAGNIAATTVQGAINELDTEKAIKGANNDITSLTALSSINGGQLAGLRNRIINGDMRVAQRGVTTTAPIGNVAYTLDRWLVGSNTTTTPVNQSAQASFPYNYMQLSGSAGNTGISIKQRIESVNVRDLAGQTVTLSFYFYNSGGNAPSGSIVINYPTAVDNYTAVTQISSTAITVGVTTKQTLTLTLPAGAYTGLEMVLSVPSCTTGALVFHTVQLEIGSVATTFEQRHYGMELALCQRYYQTARFYVGTVPVQSFYPVQMRGGPSILGGGAGFTNNGYAESLVCSQTTPANQTLTFSVEL